MTKRKNLKSTVEPIRDWSKLEDVLNYCLKTNQFRNWLMIKLGLNFALRISDLLTLRISDLYDSDMYPKSRVILRERKTGKENFIEINNGSKEALKEYYKLSRISFSNEFILRSRQGANKSISRIQAYRILNKIAQQVGIEGINIGTHTLRKTWGYHAYTKFNLSLDSIMLKLNHQSIQSTKRYIGLTADEKAEIENKVNF